MDGIVENGKLIPVQSNVFLSNEINNIYRKTLISHHQMHGFVYYLVKKT